MMTSGLVVSVNPDAGDLDSTREAIRTAGVFAPGNEHERVWPLALEADDAVASECWCQWLRQLPGVEDVDVVFVHWDAEELHVGV